MFSLGEPPTVRKLYQDERTFQPATKLTTCAHPKRDAIDEELASGATYQSIARKFEWLAVRDAVFGALTAYPEARAVVFGRLLEPGAGAER